MLVHARPGAKKDAIVGEYNGRLKISLNAPPIDGRANSALIAFLAKKLKVAKSAITLSSGETNRSKRLIIAGLSVQQVRDALNDAL